MRHNHRRKADSSISEEDASEAIRVASAVEKYVGGADAANEALGIRIERQVKWSREVLLDLFKRIIDEYGLSPNQLIYDHRKGKIELPSDKLKMIGQVKDAVTRIPGGLAGIYSELGIQAPKRERG